MRSTIELIAVPRPATVVRYQEIYGITRAAGFTARTFDLVDASCRVVHGARDVTLGLIRARVEQLQPDAAWLRQVTFAREVLPFDLELRWTPGTLRLELPAGFAGPLRLAALLRVGDPTAGSCELVARLLAPGTRPTGDHAFLAMDAYEFALDPYPLPAPEPASPSMVMRVGERVAPVVRFPASPPATEELFPAFDFHERHLARYGFGGKTRPEVIVDELVQTVDMSLPAPVSRPVVTFTLQPRGGPPAELSERSHARWKLSDEWPLTSAGQASQQSMPPILRGRKAGDGDELAVEIDLARSDPRVVKSPPTIVPVEVTPVDLELSVRPSRADEGAVLRAGGRPSLRLEYRWLEDERRLAGELHFDVRRKGVEEPDSLLFSSTWPSVIELAGSDADLLITRLQTTDPYTGTSLVCPFGVRLTLMDAPGSAGPVARFTIPPGMQDQSTLVEPGGRFDFQRFLSAVGPGRAVLRVELVPAAPELAIDEFRLPPEAVLLDVEVPPPLEGTLDAWKDAHHTAGVDLGPGAPPAVIIHASGKVSGTVANRSPRPHPELERVEISIETADHRRLGPYPVTGDPDFEQAFADLAEGVNRVVLDFWKPINEVMGRPTSAEAELRGVLPEVDDVVLPRALPANDVVLRRGIDGVSYRYRLATSAQLVDLNASGATNLGPSQGGSFDWRDVRLPSASLPAVFGDHHLQVVARNDFGPAVPRRRHLFAPRPVLAIEPDTRSLPHEATNPLHVGHSVEVVAADVRIRFALSTVFEQLVGGSVVDTDRVQPSEARALAGEVRLVDLPDGGRLEIGDNVFRLVGSNEFGTVETSVTLHRRDHVFDFVAEFRLEPVDERAHLQIGTVRPSNLGIDEGTSQGFDAVLRARGSSTPLGLELIRFNVARDHGESPATLDFRIALFTLAASVGPDFEPFVHFMDIPAGDVDPDESQAFPVSLVRSDDVQPGHSYWTSARVKNTSTNERTIVFVIGRLD